MGIPEPFNIFSHRIDVQGVIDCCRGVASEVQVFGPEDDWREIIPLGPKKLFGRRARLKITHDSQFYGRPDWPRYISGMVNYVSTFSAVPRQAEIIRVVESFRFLLAFPDVDLSVRSDDARVAWVHEICRRLDGVIFTPSMLLDANGRLIISSNGRFDPAAVLPATPARTNTTESVDPDPFHVEDMHDVAPPTAERIARRAVVLAAVGNRGLIENEGGSLNSPEKDRNSILTWIRESDVAHELEPDEWKVLQRPWGSLESQALVNSVWRLEGLGVLLWALGLYELPPYDQVVNPGEIFELVGFYEADETRGVIATAKLRSSEELASYRTHAIMAHWRFRNFSLRPGPFNFVEFSKDCWIGTFDITRFRIAENDVVVGKREISKADPIDVQKCHSIAQERHVAINWILGESEIYSQTDTST